MQRNCFESQNRGGVVVWIVSDGTENGSESGTSFRQALYFKDCGFNLNDTMIWKKDGFSFPEAVRYPQNFEYMFVLSKGRPKVYNPIKDRRNKNAGIIIQATYRQKDGSTTKRHKRETDAGGIKEYGTRFNVWEIPCDHNNKTGHPAVFPFDLARDHILSWSNKGDTVLDPFMGSGTTGIACVDTGRDFIGIEISQDFYELSKQRITEASAQVRMDI